MERAASAVLPEQEASGPHCGGVLPPGGRRSRAVLTPGQPDPVRLERP